MAARCSTCQRKMACFDQNHAKFMAETAKCRILGHYQFTRTTFDLRVAGLKLLEGMRFWRFIPLGKWVITKINGYQWYYHLKSLYCKGTHSPHLTPSPLLRFGHPLMSWYSIISARVITCHRLVPNKKVSSPRTHF